METVRKDSIWLPTLLDSLFFENGQDVLNNYETFSIPALNVKENLSMFVLEFSVPGWSKEDFSIELEEDRLKVASKEANKKEDNDDSRFLRREFSSESFERIFQLPENIETDNIEAHYEDGILRVILPKMEEKKVLKKMVEIS